MPPIRSDNRFARATIILFGTLGIAIGCLIYQGTRHHYPPVHITNGNPIDLGERLSFQKLLAQVELRNDSKHPQVLERLQNY